MLLDAAWRSREIDPELSKYKTNPPPEGFGILYVITRLTGSQKSYIGQFKGRKSKKPSYRGAMKRLKEHTYEKHTYIGKALRKHGIDDFAFEILCLVPLHQINSMERQCIADLETLSPNGYNIDEGGFAGATTPELREKIRAAKSTPEAKARQSKLAKARWKDPKFHKLMSEATTSAFKNPETKLRHSTGCKKRATPSYIQLQAQSANKTREARLRSERATETVLEYEPLLVNRIKGQLYTRLDGKVGRWNGRDLRVSRFD